MSGTVGFNRIIATVRADWHETRAMTSFSWRISVDSELFPSVPELGDPRCAAEHKPSIQFAMACALIALSLTWALAAAQEWTLDGAASYTSVSGRTPITLTNEIPSIFGSAQLTSLVSIDRDFTVEFQFTISQSGICSFGADGVHMHLFNGDRRVAVDFDTYNNQCHIIGRSSLLVTATGLSEAGFIPTTWPSCSDGQFDTTSYLPWNTGEVISATVAYFDSARVLSVTARRSSGQPYSFNFSLGASVQDVLGAPSASLKYWASTGSACSLHVQYVERARSHTVCELLSRSNLYAHGHPIGHG